MYSGFKCLHLLLSLLLSFSSAVPLTFCFLLFRHVWPAGFCPRHLTQIKMLLSTWSALPALCSLLAPTSDVAQFGQQGAVRGKNYIARRFKVCVCVCVCLKKKNGVVSQVLVNRSWSKCSVRTCAETEKKVARVGGSSSLTLCCLPLLWYAVNKSEKKNPYLIYDLLRRFFFQATNVTE